MKDKPACDSASSSPSKSPPQSPTKSPKAKPPSKVAITRPPAKAKADTTIPPNGWVSPATIPTLTFGVKPGIRDTTAVAGHLNEYKPTLLESQYLSQVVTVARTPAPGEKAEYLPALALHGVRIQYKKPHSRYGKDFVQMAVPTGAVEEMMDQLGRAGVATGPAFVQEETVRFLDGVEFTSFRVDIKKLPCTWTRDGQSRAIQLGHELTKVARDLLGSVVFNLGLKYKGGKVADVAKAPMALKFEAVRLEVTGAAREALDPEEAVATESWAEKAERLGGEGYLHDCIDCM